MEPSPRQRRSRLALTVHLAQRTLAGFFGDRCPQLAAAISYHALFSLFPLAIVLTAVFGIVLRTTGIRADVVDTIAGSLPLSPAGERDLRGVLRGATGGASALGLVGVLGLLVSASGLMAALRTALNAAFDVEEDRPFLKGKLVDVALVGAAGVAAIVSLGLTVAVRVAGGGRDAQLQVALGGGWAAWTLGLLAPFVFAFAIVFGLYRLVPATAVRSRHAAPVALGIAALFVAGENLFALYVRHFASYNLVYGSLGAVIALMFFVYVSAWLMLLGAELTSEWPRAVRAFERGEVEPGPSLAVQARQFVRGLWGKERRREAGREERRRHAGREELPRDDECPPQRPEPRLPVPGAPVSGASKKV